MAHDGSVSIFLNGTSNNGVSSISGVLHCSPSKHYLIIYLKQVSAPRPVI